MFRISGEGWEVKRKLPNSFLSRNYILVILLVFAILFVGIWGISQEAYLTTTPAAASQTQQQVSTLRQTVTPWSIFENNLFVSIFAIIPVGGLIFFGRIWINTGQAIGQLAYYNHISPLVYVVNIYIPVGILENMAYSVILAEGLFLTYSLAKGTFFERLRFDTWKSVVLYLVLLAVAATVEAALIQGHL